MGYELKSGMPAGLIERLPPEPHAHPLADQLRAIDQSLRRNKEWAKELEITGGLAERLKCDHARRELYIKRNEIQNAILKANETHPHDGVLDAVNGPYPLVNGGGDFINRDEDNG